MTFVIAVREEAGVYLFCDSALTHTGPLTTPHLSSFGEAQQLDGRVVEESLVKIFELPRSVLAAISGTLEPALAFLRSVELALATTPQPLPEILANFQRPPTEGEAFQLIFAHLEGGHAVLTCYTPGRPIVSPIAAVTMMGGLPREHGNLFMRLAAELRELRATPAGRMAATLVALHTLSVTEALTAHSVGGAFFAAHLDASGITWQPDVLHSMCAPRAGGSVDLVANTFVCVRRGVGIAAALDHRADAPPSVVKWLLPPFRPADAEKRLPKSQNLHKVVARSRYYAFFHLAKRRSVLIEAPNDGRRGIAWIERKEKAAMISMHTQLGEILEEEVPDGMMAFTMHYEPPGAERKGPTLLMPLEPPPNFEIYTF